MTQLTPSALDRRSGNDRRQGDSDSSVDAAADVGTPLKPPFVLAPELEGMRPRDPWVSVVARSIDEYCAGRTDELVGTWDESLIWRIVASWPSGDRAGAAEVFAWHRAAQEATAGTFRQEVLALDGSGGPIVVAHVRTTAARGTRRLETPSMLTFELVAMRIRRVTEIPGDAAAWDRFWAD